MPVPDESTMPDVIEPQPLPQLGDPKTARWTLYDEDFSIEHRLKYALTESGHLRIPHFTPTAVAEWVFGRDGNWARYVLGPRKSPLKTGPHDPPLVFRRLAGGRLGGAGERRLTLPDIERFAHALYRRGDIDGLVLQAAHEIVCRVAQQYLLTKRPY
ncbi:hypothetical protein ACFZAM_31410 [Streptomyces sp. NPDC008079]|uniref:hypothetical protein n=1 Tax=Streptomyces sp. NPDC008079 TaxID=3364806 RepID=UPI0036F01B65